MSIHIYRDKAQSDLVFELKFDLIEKLNRVWFEFKKKTGITISEYDNAIIQGRQVELLAILLANNADLLADAGAKAFLIMLKSCRTDDALYLIGE